MSGQSSSPAAEYAETVLAIRQLEARRDQLKAQALEEVEAAGGAARFTGPDGAALALELKPGRERLMAKYLEADCPDVYRNICELKPSLKLFKAAASMGMMPGLDEEQAVERYTERGDPFLQLRTG